jgi:hypothetical protein
MTRCAAVAGDRLATCAAIAALRPGIAANSLTAGCLATGTPLSTGKPTVAAVAAFGSSLAGTGAFTVACTKGPATACVTGMSAVATDTLGSVAAFTAVTTSAAVACITSCGISRGIRCRCGVGR